MDDWAPVACAVADAIRQSPVARPVESSTDMSRGGTTHTTWAVELRDGGELVVLKEWLYDRDTPDMRCEPIVPTPRTVSDERNSHS